MNGLSVVTISYNQAKYLEDNLRSIREQDSKTSIEHIVVDPGSTDGSREIVHRAGVQKYVFEPDRGPADGLNKGFDLATGEWSCFLNSDDFFLPGAIATVEAFLQTRPNLDIALFGGVIANEAGESVKSVHPSRFSPQRYARGAVTFFQQGMFFRTNLLRRYGGFNSENRINWDGELMLKFALNNCRIARCDVAVAAFRAQPESLTVTNRMADQYRSEGAKRFREVYLRERNRIDPWTDVAYRLHKSLTHSIPIRIKDAAAALRR